MKIRLYETELTDYGHCKLVEKDYYEYQQAEKVPLSDPGVVVDMFDVILGLRRKTEEYLYMLAVDTRCVPVGLFEVSHGTVNFTVVRPREIFIRALLCNASGIIVVHNHPSQNTTPSEDDMHVMKEIKRVGKLIGISLFDSIIVGEDYFSFKAHGLL